jgi:hypothetical protein
MRQWSRASVSCRHRMLPLLLVVVVVVLLLPATTVATAFSVEQDEGSMRSYADASGRHRIRNHRRLSEPMTFPLERQLVFQVGDTSTGPVKQLKVTPPVEPPDRNPDIETIKYSLRVRTFLLVGHMYTYTPMELSPPPQPPLTRIVHSSLFPLDVRGS